MQFKEMVEHELSRIRLLLAAGKTAFGAAAFSMLASSRLKLLSAAEAKEWPSVKWPWPYAKLDSDKSIQPPMAIK